MISEGYQKKVPFYCYELMQVFTVTGLFAGQHNTKLHGTITGVILSYY